MTLKIQTEHFLSCLAPLRNVFMKCVVQHNRMNIRTSNPSTEGPFEVCYVRMR